MPNTHAYKKLSYITHAYSCAFLLSLLLQEHEHSGCVFGLSEVLASLPDHEPYISVTAAAKQFRPLDVCWYRFHTTNIAHLCLNVYVLVARKHPRTQTHTHSFVRASHKRQLMASMWRVNMCVFVGKVSLGVP